MNQIVRLSPESLAQAVEGTKLTEQSRRIAYMVMVEGRSQKDVAALMGQSQPNVSAIIRRIRQRLDSNVVSGSSWVQMSIELPKGLSDELALFSSHLKNTQDPDGQRAAIRCVQDAIATARAMLVRTPRSE